MRPRSVLFAALAIAVAGLALFFVFRRSATSVSSPAAGPPWARPEASRFVGREACVKCHEKEAAGWALSDHARAMQPMNGETVLADFGGTSRSRKPTLLTRTAGAGPC